MNKIMCSIRDITADFFGPPFMTHNHGTAMRDFAQACSDTASPLNHSPESFALYYIADYEDSTGIITPVPQQLVAHATQFTKE